jgi:hypothetical protein
MNQPDTRLSTFLTETANWLREYPDDAPFYKDALEAANDMTQAATRAAELETALRNLIRILELVPYRDATGLRMGPGIPHFDRAKEALENDSA